MGFGELCALISEETRRHCIPLLDIALVNEQGIMLRRRFANGDEEAVDPAAVPAVFRAGSVSKMLTAVSIMRSVEAGEVDLDVPLTSYCPELAFADPHGAETPITLRHLLSHTAGIQRESPVGSYYDSSEPTVEQSVRSMIGTTLVFPPGTHAKYSNIGPTMAAYVVEKATGVPWQERIERAILRPLALEHSSFSLARRPVQGTMTEAFMPGLDGPFSPAPRFNLGTPASGNLYSTVEDLALFMRCLLAGGSAGAYRMLRAETLQQMYRIQSASPGSSAGFGLGFMVGSLDGHRHVGHGGAVYGYSSDFVACIDDKVGVIILNNLDCTGGVNAKIRNASLSRLLSTDEEPENRSDFSGFPGIYRAGEDDAEVTAMNGTLVLRSTGTSKRLRRVGADLFVSDDRLSTGLKVVFLRDAAGSVAGLTAGETRYLKAQGADTAGTSSAGIDASGAGSLERFCGDYGPPHAGLRLFLRASRLVCRIEWFYEYDLSRTDESRFLFPAYGMFEGEDLRFIEAASGTIVAVSLSGIRFQRREGATSENSR